jgi:hypothetical protein
VTIAKLELLSPYFRRWQRVLYMDCDCLVQNDLNRACDEMATRFPSILCDSSHATAGITVLANWQYFHKTYGGDVGSEQPLYQKLLARYPGISEQLILCTSAICFAPESIPDGTDDLLFSVVAEFERLNPGHIDQPVFATVLYDKMAGMGKDYCSWFAFDEPGNRVSNPAIGVRGDEFPAIIHYWGMYAPWLVKQEGAGGHFNTRLGRVCHELYAENLAAFETVFPRL